MDDRWVFTPRIPSLNYASIAALAAASRALRDYDKDLSDESLELAIRAWESEHKESGLEYEGEIPLHTGNAELSAALQLFITTKNEHYLTIFTGLLWPSLDKSIARNIQTAARAYPFMNGENRDRLKSYVIRYRAELDTLEKDNPFGVLIGKRGWGGDYELVDWAITNFYLNRAFPEVVGPEYVYKGLHYLFGCHPYSNISFVSGVGTHSKKVAYGSNRADYSFIAGGVVPGLLLLKPDFLENKEDWPFLWGENECVIDICAKYIFLANAAGMLLEGGR